MPRKDKERDAVKAAWDHNAVNIFCDLCVEEISIGNRPTNYFTKEGWENISNKFFEITGRKYTKSQIRNKWDMLKDKWRLWRQFKTNENGLSWDSMRNTVYASEEWWDQKIQVNDKFKQFKTRGVSPELEAKLNTMFVVDIGQHALGQPLSICPPIDNGNEKSGQQTNSGGSEDSDEDSKVHVQGLVNVVHETEDNRDKLATFRNGRLDDLVQTALSCSKKRQSEKIKQEKIAKVRKSSNDKFFTKSEQRAEELHSTSNETSQVVPQRCTFSVLDAFKVVNSMEGVPKMSELKFFALNLILDKEKRELFMALDSDERLWWLKSFFEESKK